MRTSAYVRSDASFVTSIAALHVGALRHATAVVAQDEVRPALAGQERLELRRDVVDARRRARDLGLAAAVARPRRDDRRRVDVHAARRVEEQPQRVAAIRPTARRRRGSARAAARASCRSRCAWSSSSSTSGSSRLSMSTTARSGRTPSPRFVVASTMSFFGALKLELRRRGSRAGGRRRAKRVAPPTKRARERDVLLGVQATARAPATARRSCGPRSRPRRSAGLRRRGSRRRRGSSRPPRRGPT